MIAGGGALLKNLDLFLRSEIDLPVKIAGDPLSAVALGAGKAIDNLAILRDLEKGEAIFRYWDIWYFELLPKELPTNWNSWFRFPPEKK